MKDLTKLSVIELVALREHLEIKRELAYSERLSLCYKGVVSDEDRFIELLDIENQLREKKDLVTKEIEKRDIEI